MATGFFWRKDQQMFLVTNWHVVTGVNPETGEHLSNHAAEPDRIAFAAKTAGRPAWNHGHVELNDGDGQPIWFEHPTSGRAIDVAAVPVTLPVNSDVKPLNECPTRENMLVAVGMDAFVLGFPLGQLPTGALPVWKRASIATEPCVPVHNLPDVPKFLVDTATRRSMSGSPVILRWWGIFPEEDGGVAVGTDDAAAFTRILGVYSGRLGVNDGDVEAQLGVVWRIDAVEEVVAGGRRATHPFVQ